MAQLGKYTHTHLNYQRLSVYESVCMSDAYVWRIAALKAFPELMDERNADALLLCGKYVLHMYVYITQIYTQISHIYTLITCNNIHAYVCTPASTAMLVATYCLS